MDHQRSPKTPIDQRLILTGIVAIAAIGVANVLALFMSKQSPPSAASRDATPSAIVARQPTPSPSPSWVSNR